MKKFTSLLIGCSLALAGAAWAQQPEEQQSPSKGKHKEKAPATEAQPGTNQEKAGKHQRQGARNEQGATNERGTGQGRKGRAKQESSATETNATGQQTDANATPNADQQGKKGRHGRNAHGANAKTAPNATPVTTGAAPSVAPAAGTSAGAAVSGSTAGQQNAQANPGGRGKKPDRQVVEQVKQQHQNFRAQARPDKVPAVTFNQSYRIQGSDRWQGPQYEVFRSYHPERHDQGWYRSHYQRIELIGGGYYYWHNNYWYPAWGFSPQAEYYVYDGPIYVGHRAEPPDRVIADVQAVLQQMGYYRGEVDGLLGPLTREALTAYQADNGLTQTAAIDEPTLDSLEMG